MVKMCSVKVGITTKNGPFSSKFLPSSCKSILTLDFCQSLNGTCYTQSQCMAV